MNAIEINDVYKAFGDRVVLNKISVSFEKGKIHGIVGRNGSGKTVLLECICGIMHQNKGNIIVNGKSIGKDKDIAEDIGVIIETPGFLPNYSGFRNLKYLMGIKKKADNLIIVKTMEIVGLDAKDKKKVGKYSLGMRQRLGIAQAIMDNPQILILDEPMNGLDNQGVKDMRIVLANLKKQGITILLASHNKEDIDTLCDTVHEMDRGEMRRIR